MMKTFLLGTVKLTLVCLFVLPVILLNGCGDSSEAADARNADEAVRVASRLIRAGQQDPGSKDTVFAQAQELEAGMQELIAQLQGDLPREKVLEISRQLNELSRTLLAASPLQRDLRPADLQARLEKAESQLKQSLPKATAGQKAALNLMLGLLYQTLARDHHDLLIAQKARMSGIQNEILFLTRRLMSEQTYATGLSGLFPKDQMVADIQNRLTGDDSLTGMLNNAQLLVDDLTQQQATLQDQIDRTAEVVRQKQRNYSELLNRAVSAESPLKFNLEKQAQAILGKPDNPESLISYEARLQEQKNELARLAALVEIARFEHQLLTVQIQTNRDLIGELQQHPLLKAIDEATQSSAQSTQQIAADLLGRVEKLTAAEAQYVELRNLTVGTYQKAAGAYNALKQSARAQRAFSDFADEQLALLDKRLANPDYTGVADLAERTPAGLWQEEALLYDRLAAMLQILQEAPLTREVAAGLQQEYGGKAQQARQSADESLSQNAP